MPVKTDVKLTTLSYVIVYVKDADKAKSFYRDTLGMKLKVDDEGWVEFESGATTLALHSDPKLSDQRAPGQPMPVFQVEDINRVYQSLKNAGVKFESSPRKVCEVGPKQVGMSADFFDPDGNA